MKQPRVRFTVRRIWTALVVAWAAATIAFTAAMDSQFFADTTPAFRLNAAVVWVVPSALFAGTLAAIAWAVRALRRPAGLRIGIRGMIVAVALIGSWLGVARWWVVRNFVTVYSAGYDEVRFRLVRVGMTPGEVESLLGRPLLRDSTSQRWAPYENWIYSEPPPPGTIGDNYWRRWVMFEGGRVAVIVDDYYED
jgi:hypothetical protein